MSIMQLILYKVFIYFDIAPLTLIGLNLFNITLTSTISGCFRTIHNSEDAPTPIFKIPFNFVTLTNYIFTNKKLYAYRLEKMTARYIFAPSFVFIYFKNEGGRYPANFCHHVL